MLPIFELFAWPPQVIVRVDVMGNAAQYDVGALSPREAAWERGPGSLCLYGNPNLALRYHPTDKQG